MSCDQRDGLISIYKICIRIENSQYSDTAPRDVTDTTRALQSADRTRAYLLAHTAADITVMIC